MHAATAQKTWPPTTLPSGWRQMSSHYTGMTAVTSEDGRFMITFADDRSGALYSVWDQIAPLGTCPSLEEAFRMVRALRTKEGLEAYHADADGDLEGYDGA